jgi:hypothetical protein
MGTTYVPAGTAKKIQNPVRTLSVGLAASMDIWVPNATRGLTLGLPLEAKPATDGGMDETKLTATINSAAL